MYSFCVLCCGSEHCFKMNLYFSVCPMICISAEDTGPVEVQVEVGALENIIPVPALHPGPEHAPAPAHTLIPAHQGNNHVKFLILLLDINQLAD